MAISKVQSIANCTVGQSVNTYNLTYPGSTTTGNLGLCFVASYGLLQYTNTLTDNKSNTWIRAGGVVNRDMGMDTIDLWYCPNMTGGASHQVTANMTGNDNIGILLAEFSGVATSSPLDQTNCSTVGQSTASQSGSVTTTTTNQLIISAGTDQVPTAVEPTYGSGYTKLDFAGTANNSVRVYGEFKILPSAGSVNAPYTLSANQYWANSIATFKEQAAPAALNRTQDVAMLGIG